MKRCIDRTDEGPGCDRIADRTLLKRFADRGDEAAFAELVSRYGGLVFGVCRRVLADRHDAEDAFQATFLVLARSASKIRRRSSLAGWLYAVARRTAFRANTKRQRRREETFEDDVMVTDDTLAQVTSRYEQQLLDEELDRLPPHYREPLVLRYLLGKSNKQVAEQLGLTLGVVEGRLKRGKNQLRMRLARRGVGLTVLLAAAGSMVAAEAATVDSLIAATVQSAVAFRTDVKLPSGDCSSNSIQLANQEIAMSLSTATTSTFTISSITAALVITGLTLAAAGTTGNQPAQAGPPKLVATTSADTADTSNIKRAAIAVAASDASDDSKDGDTDTTAPVADPAPTSGYGGFGGGTGLPTPNGFGGGISSGLGRNRSTTASTRSRETHDAADGSAEAGVVDFKQYTASETKIVEALKSQTRLEFIETPLRDVVDFLKEQHDIEIQIDTRALDNMAMTPDEPITKSLRGLSLRSALRLTLRDLGLTYIIRDEVLTITTKDVADSTLDTRVYGLRTDYDPEPLVEMIRKHVSPQSWDESGGQGAISAAGGLLVISQTQQIHEEILEFLGQLEKAHVLGGE